MERFFVILTIMFCSTADRIYAQAAELPPIVVVYAMVSLFADVGLSARDAGLFLEGKRPSYKYGVFETVVALPQALYFTVNSSSKRDGRRLWLTVWMAALTAHGVWTIKSSISQTDFGMKKHEKFNITAAPTIIPSSSGAMNMGIGMNIRF